MNDESIKEVAKATQEVAKTTSKAMDYEALETALAAAINPDADLYKEAVAKAEQRPAEFARLLLNDDLAKPVVSVLGEQPEFE